MSHGITETSKVAAALALVALLTTLGACSQSRGADDGVTERCEMLVEINEALDTASYASTLAGMAVHAERLSALARKAGNVGLDEVGRQLQQVSEALDRGNFEALDISGQRLVVAVAEVQKECAPAG